MFLAVYICEWSYMLDVYKAHLNHFMCVGRLLKFILLSPVLIHCTTAASACLCVRECL